MSYLLLLVNSDGQATTCRLAIRQLREFPSGEGLSVHFRPIRNDLLFESGKLAGQLAYRVLRGEGMVRHQLWVEYEVLGTHLNVTGRSSDLLFALALITSKWKKPRGRYPAIAATGVLDGENAALTGDGGSIQRVKHTVAKVAAAVSALLEEPEAIIFYPADDAEAIATWSNTAKIPGHIRLHAAQSLEDALAVLGILLEKVYLGNPFRGLEHFDYQHRSIFFGRDAEVTELLDQLLRREATKSPGILVEGASGSGKSSFLRAGVLPALVHPGSQPTPIEQALRQRPVHDDVKRAVWRIGLLPPKSSEEMIARSILDCWQKLPELADGLCGKQPLCLSNLIELRRRNWPTTQRFVWLLDQFEEIFTLGLPESVIDTFGQFLIDLQSDGAWTLASIRSDAMVQLKLYHRLRQVFGANEGQYYLETISATALEDVVYRPAEAAGLSFGRGPTGRPLDQIIREHAYEDHENTLPLLQFTLHELYQRRSGKELTYAAYAELGGLSGSVATIADGVLKASASQMQNMLPVLFRSLVGVDEAGRASRRYASMAEIGQEPARKQLLLRLVEARLCVTDQREGEAVVLFAHEALLRTWPVLIDWLQRESALLQSRELAQREARMWQHHGQSDEWLATADKLVAFQRVQSAGIFLPDVVRSFINRSARSARRTTRLKQAAFSAVAVLAIFALVAGWTASRRQREAEHQAVQALQAQARLLVQTADLRLKEGDLRIAQGIIVEVLDGGKFAQSGSATAINVFQKVRAADALTAVLSGHGDLVRYASYSPNGASIVSASNDSTARIWDPLTGTQELVLSGHTGAVSSAAYSPDGTQIVTASSDGTARIWSASSGELRRVLSGHSDRVEYAAFSPDGNRIVTASSDKAARVWDASTGATLMVLTGHTNRILSAAYSPDGTRIVTASWDKTARIWDARTGRSIALLSGHRDLVSSAAYSPDGARIVTASWDKTARVWDAESAAQVAVLSGHTDVITGAAYSPDGKHIATVSKDETLRIWDAMTGAPLKVVSGQGDRMGSAAYSPDGTQIVTAGFSPIARIWNAQVGMQLAILKGHSRGVGSARYSPDGSRILTASDKNLRVWDAASGALLSTLCPSGATYASADYSPDGTKLISASYDKTARVWDADTGLPITVLSGHAADVLSAAYSPDGTRIVTASYDSTARIWDTRTGSQIAMLAGHHASVQWAAYAPDGKHVVTASLDGTGRIWDARTGFPLAFLYGHGGGLSSAVYSPDGKQIATASTDKTARIWDARTGQQLHVLSGHDATVESVAYSPDGIHVLTASKDKTIRIWSARTGEQLAVLLGHDDVVETAAYSSDGSRIVSASDDTTARIWAADVPLPLADQIIWYKAAQTDILSDVDRTELGLNREPQRVRADSGTACDRAAGAFYDPDRVTTGVIVGHIIADVAIVACGAEIRVPRRSARIDYQMGRALLVKREFTGAKQHFEHAIAKGYRAAQIDLAKLLLDDTAGLVDPARAIALYEEAWKSGVQIAAYQLGYLYEMGMASVDNRAQPSLSPDMDKAQYWYEQAAAVNEPSALARYAERAERIALRESDPEKKNSLLLRSFRFYAAAAERASDEAWPDEVWRQWRYRRATLARVLARQGMMQQVVEALRFLLPSIAGSVSDFSAP